MRPIQQPTAEARIVVNAPPDVVWKLVSDITRTPEWSPVVKRSEWLGRAAQPGLGARFKGHNRFNGFRWSRECVVSEWEPGRRFAFSTLGRDGGEQTRWRYRLEPSHEGTEVALEYEVVSIPLWVRMARRLPRGKTTSERQARWNLEESLTRLRALVD